MISSAKTTVRVLRGCAALLFAAGAVLSVWTPAFGQELPREFLDTTYAPPPGRIIPVPGSGDFQTALEMAQPGDIIELAAGQTFTGNFVLPPKEGNAWIHVRSSAHLSLPDPGTRVSPSDAAFMARIVSANSVPAIRATLRTDVSPPIPSHHFRFVGIEITTTSPALANLVWLEHSVDGGSQQDDLGKVPTDIVFDRCYIHGTPSGNVRRGIALNSARTAVIDSYLSDFHEVGADSQAIAGWNGPGPFKIVNNYLEGAGENVMFGGGDPLIVGLVPSDIEIRRNHFFKPLAWRQAPWSVKNLFELKNARRVLVEGNVLENNWLQSQVGVAVLFTVRNQDGGCLGPPPEREPWCAVEDVTFRRNIVRQAAGALSITGTDNNYPTRQTSRILIRDNLIYRIDPVEFGGGCCGRSFQLLNGESPGRPGGIKDLIVDHNTARISDSDTAAIVMGDSTDAEDRHQNPVFRNNLLERGTYGVFGSGVSEGTVALDTYATAWTFEKNVVIGAPPEPYPPQDCSPAAGCYPATLDDVGFVDWRNDEYRLGPTSPYKGGGTDGKDIGADIDLVLEATAGVVVTSQLPFTGTPFTVPGRFEAEDFDRGGEGVAYHDSSPGNTGGLYRTSEDVDIVAAIGNATGYVVMRIETGEWLEYTIDVAAAGLYRVELNASSRFASSRFHVEVDGADVTGPVVVPKTGRRRFELVGAGGVNLSSGAHVLRVYSERAYFDLDAIRICRSRPRFPGQCR
jgi:hypothetical protein